jgi:hypothetical protein
MISLKNVWRMMMVEQLLPFIKKRETLDFECVPNAMIDI